jgi:hypothetical protein
MRKPLAYILRLRRHDWIYSNLEADRGLFNNNNNNQNDINEWHCNAYAYAKPFHQ